MKTTDPADLQLNWVGGPNGYWRMSKDMGMGQGPGHYPPIKVAYDHEGQFTFVINSPKDVTFAASGAFQAKALKTMPKDFGDQFTVKGEGTNTLTVTDANANKGGGHYTGGDYHYELHFSNGTTLDPIISNGGCCSSQAQSSLVYYALGFVALAALIVLFVRPMMARRARSAIDPAVKNSDED